VLAFIIAEQNYKILRKGLCQLALLIDHYIALWYLTLQKQGAGLVFAKFYFSKKCGFHCFPATNNRHHKELIELQVEKCELVLYYVFEESRVHSLT